MPMGLGGGGSQPCYRATWLMMNVNKVRSSWGSTEQVAQPESKVSLRQMEEAKKELIVLIGSVIGEDPGRICSAQQ